jgi:hypothetical protein
VRTAAIWGVGRTTWQKLSSSPATVAAFDFITQSIQSWTHSAIDGLTHAVEAFDWCGGSGIRGLVKLGQLVQVIQSKIDCTIRQYRKPGGAPLTKKVVFVQRQICLTSRASDSIQQPFSYHIFINAGQLIYNAAL